MFSLKNISFGYNKDCFWKSLSLDFERNGIYLLLGPNGCGKSTFLKFLNGDDPFKEEKKDSSLFFLKNSLEEDYLKPKEFINFYKSLFSIDQDLTISYNEEIRNLSQGQKQHLILSLLKGIKEKIILLDEPTINLDEKNIEFFKQDLLSLKEEKIFIIATHDFFHLENIYDGLLFLTRDKIYQLPKYDGPYFYSKNISEFVRKNSKEIVPYYYSLNKKEKSLEFLIENNVEIDDFSMNQLNLKRIYDFFYFKKTN